MKCAVILLQKESTMKLLNIFLLSLSGIGLFTSTLADDVLPNECGYFTTAVSTRSECSSATPGVIEFTGKANIYDNLDTILATCTVTTPQWVLDQTQTCESGDCEAEPGSAKNLSIDYDHPPSAASTDSSPSSSRTDITVDADKTLTNAEYDTVNFNYAGNGKTATFEQSSSWTSSAKTLKVNSITSAWQILFKNDVNIEIGSITGASYGSPITIKTDSSNIDTIAIDSMKYKENTLIDLEAKTSIDIKTFEVGRGSSTVTLKAKTISIDTLTVSNSGSGQADITIIADDINIGTLEMGQGAKVTILPYTQDQSISFKSNTINASSSSELILSSGNYYTTSFNIPGTSDASSVRAKDENQLINFYINGNFEPGNNPGINSAGNDANFGTLPAKNFRMFINGDLNTGGGGTTFNAVIYIEGDATLGNPTYIRGALSANTTIKIGQDSKIYYSGDPSNAAYLMCPIPGESDLCYSTPTATGFNIFGFGMFYGVTTPINNISGESITNATIIKSFDGIDMSMMSKIKIDGTEKTTAKDSDEAEINQDLQANFRMFNAGGIFNKGIVYRIDTFDANQSHTIYDYSMFSFDMSKIKIDTIYTKNGKRYYSTIYPCGGGGNSNYVTGPFDAWDTFRNQSATPPTDRNISTKIVNKNFELSLASLNKTNDAYEGKLGDVDVAIYPRNSLNGISNHISFAASTAHTNISAPLKVTKASRDAVVGFKICATYENNITTNTKEYFLYPANSCSAQTTVNDCNATTTGTPTWHICYSSDNFAIRPKEYSITAITTPIKSAKTTSFVIKAIDDEGNAAADYNITQADYALDINQTKYMPDGAINNSLYGTASLSTYRFNDGLSNDTNISYDDIGNISILLQDRDWTAVDSDDTPASCQENQTLEALVIPEGRYICGETNASFIPDHFDLTNAITYNENNGSFTYLSSDLNMSASLSLDIAAKNMLGAVTKNFDHNSWVHPLSVNIHITATGVPTPLTNDITTENLDFTNGTYTISWNEATDTKNLLFNFTRETNQAKNPFLFSGSDINVSANTNYGSGYDVNGSTTASNNTTFYYGRTHATRQRFIGQDGNVSIYYEVYCSGSTCNKSLLQDGVHSKTTDDPRWFINTKHVATLGLPGDVNQKTYSVGHGYVKQIQAATGNTPDHVELNYNGDRGYPYKTTMENNASSWLIFNPYNTTAQKNEFDVEFINSSSNWAGQHETNTSTGRNASDNTNRRTMW